MKREKQENKNNLENLHSNLVKTTHEKEELEAELHKVEMKYSSEACTHKLLQEDMRNLRMKFDDLNLALQISNEMVRDRESYIQDVSYERELIKNELKQAHDDIDHEQAQKMHLNDELNSLKFENSTNAAHAKDKDKLLKGIKNCYTTVSAFIHNFGSICVSSNTYSGVISGFYANLLTKNYESSLDLGNLEA